MYSSPITPAGTGRSHASRNNTAETPAGYPIGTTAVGSGVSGALMDA